VLIMTSGNASQEPIALGNREALRRLGDIADCFLLHDRDILVRCDDSVLAVLPDVETPLLYRRARGLTPKPIHLAGSGPNVLGLGAEAKSTFCLTKGSLAFVSQHIGDLDNREAFDFFLETLEHLKAVLGVEPTALIRDLHPDYLSSQLAHESQGLPVFTLQHHFAHIRAVLAENAHEDPAIGVALDGTGLGDDGTLWGGELLYVDPRTNEHHRLGHFQQIALPGGEAAIAEPWRTAQSHLYALGEAVSGNEGWPWLAEHSKASRLVGQMLEKGVNCPLSSSCGRLFDAVSALLGLSLSISYEGQAAIRLESRQDPAETAGYPCPHRFSSGLSILETGQLFAAVHEAWRRKTAPGVISRRFHLGLCRGVAEWASRAAGDLGVRDVALSGGVLQNMTIASRLPEELRRMGLRPLVHVSLPPNDACISLGQAAYARTALSMARPPESPED
jgi:hydrogenase maturation protein HypF